MKINDFLDEYEIEYYQGEVYGEFAYTTETVIQMLKDLLVLAAEKARIRIVTLGQEDLPTVSDKVYFKDNGSEVKVDKQSVLNILEDE